MEQIQTPDDIKHSITKNYHELQVARERHEPDLIKLFEHRMNQGLIEYGDFLKFAGQVAVA